MNNKYNNKVKKIFQKNIALELRKRGFKIIKTGVNMYKPQYDVYFFEDTEEFERALTAVLA